MSDMKNNIKQPRERLMNDIKIHPNDPYIIKKVLDSEKVLRKYGFPELPKKKNSK